jgi:gas vesicle protein
MGITAGILIAPKSGKETRQAIAEEVESTVKKVTAPVKGKICCHKKTEKTEINQNTEDTQNDSDI